jgi:phosphate transport system permease protein
MQAVRSRIDTETADHLRRHRSRQHFQELVVKIALLLVALISVLTTTAILFSLLKDSIGFFLEVPIWDFLFGTKWTALFVPQRFGVLPLVAGTVLVAVIAGGIALVLGMGAAIFLSDYAPDRLRRILKPVLEILAGIPTVVYGFFALSFVTPLLQLVFRDLIIFNALSAGIVMGLMIMPMVSTLSEDAMVSVPRSLRDAAYALGATRFEVATKVVVPSALSGIVASLILAVSRAIGETMIVYLAAGSLANLTLNPLEPVQTMTAYIAQIATGETAQGSIVFKSIFAVGLLLFAVTLAMNVLGRWVIARYRQQYE